MTNLCEHLSNNLNVCGGVLCARYTVAGAQHPRRSRRSRDGQADGDQLPLANVRESRLFRLNPN